MKRFLILAIGLYACTAGWGQAALTYRYWFDQSTDVYTGVAEEKAWHIDLDVNHLSDGLHRLYVQVEDATGSSSVRSHLFAKVPRPEDTATLECRFYVDGELWKSEEIQREGATLAWTLDAGHLSAGLHHYTIQTVTPKGIVATLREGFFMRTTLQAEVDDLVLYYVIDEDEVARALPASVSDGVYEFSLDVASLKAGRHQLTYWLANDALRTDMEYATFVKVGDTTGIDQLDITVPKGRYFDLSGRSAVRPHGINIVPQRDGVARKILTK